jgi:hypothetical protein
VAANFSIVAVQTYKELREMNNIWCAEVSLRRQVYGRTAGMCGGLN